MKSYYYYSGYTPGIKLDSAIMTLFNGFVFTDFSEEIRRDNVIRILGIVTSAYWLNLIDSHDYLKINRYLNDYLDREFKQETI